MKPRRRSLIFWSRWCVLGVLSLAVLGGCETMDSIFQDKKKKPLAGKRISVLLHERTLKPDPQLAGEQVLLPAPQLNSDWPQAGGYPNHAMHHLKVGPVLKLAWDTDIGKGSDDNLRIAGSPIVFNGVVYAMDSESQVSAYDAKDGGRLWRTDLTPGAEDDGHIGGGIAFSNGRIFASTGFAQVVSLDAATGKEAWRRKLDGPIRAAPTVRGGRVFVVTVDNKLHALNAFSGEVLWRYAGAAELASILGGASPAVDSGVVVVAFTTGELAALRVDTGRVMWSDSLSSIRRHGTGARFSQIRGRPVIDRGRVIAISNSGVIAAIDLLTGRRIWDKQVGGLESPWVAGDYIFTLTNNYEILAMSRDTGNIRWITPLVRSEDPKDIRPNIVWTGPVLVSDRLIVAGSHGVALAVSPYTGQILGKSKLPDGVTVPPIVAGGTVFFLTDDADLAAYR